MANEVVEKIYEKIDKELGEQHVEEVVKNLMVSENNEDASRQLMELHKQCCAVFLNYSSQRPTSRTNSTKKKILNKS
ncbi:uncharacterized protein CELE_C52G5.3 [Caenorhabditis elegans]|uniref:Uncharacterized protein n=1 Tax=Caenorhabditis elegans TaxID=6239 RepID=Q7YX50_CAEEL|nr:Uncharacterized protein CELE_C52G5.3 [Caenorhabditis elegans]CAE17760.1 Uncharacterized protein CELE_C52G5.3 [Caenorhabditis elegans]|eukprot:NP_001024485.1 Uncharacterized protein CELE_C52G5.3 [Caenorhabditis elegans]